MRKVRVIQQHCKEQHNWVNDWKKGGNIKAKKQEPRQLPWIEGVWCQRLFRSCVASSWFKVKSTVDIGFSIIEDIPTAKGGDNDEEDDNKAAVLEELDEWDDMQEQRYKDGQSTRRVEELDPKNEANSWLQRVGWTRHLEGLEVEELKELIKDPAEDERLL